MRGEEWLDNLGYRLCALGTVGVDVECVKAARASSLVQECGKNCSECGPVGGIIPHVCN